MVIILDHSGETSVIIKVLVSEKERQESKNLSDLIWQRLYGSLSLQALEMEVNIWNTSIL